MLDCLCRPPGQCFYVGPAAEAAPADPFAQTTSPTPFAAQPAGPASVRIKQSVSSVTMTTIESTTHGTSQAKGSQLGLTRAGLPHQTHADIAATASTGKNSWLHGQSLRPHRHGEWSAWPVI